MLFFLLIHAEVEEATNNKTDIGVTDNKLDELKKKQNEVREELIGEKEEVVATITNKNINATKKNCPSQYNSATINISQGGCPPSNNTTAVNPQQVHDDMQQQKHRPLVVCSPSHDVFEPRDKLRDPGLPPQS